jgi:hypothetical protein
MGGHQSMGRRIDEPGGEFEVVELPAHFVGHGHDLVAVHPLGLVGEHVAPRWPQQRGQMLGQCVQPPVVAESLGMLVGPAARVEERSERRHIEAEPAVRPAALDEMPAIVHCVQCLLGVWPDKPTMKNRSILGVGEEQRRVVR